MFPVSSPLAIVDVETTGGSPLGHRVIEIGIVRLDPGREPYYFSSLVNPGRHVPHYIFELTGINPFELERAPSFEEISDKIQLLLKDTIFVAHNARFDYAFIKNEWLRMGVPFSSKTLCSVKFSRALYPEHRKHDLSSLIERHGLEMKNRHRALDDAKAVLGFFRTVLLEKGETAFAQAFDRLLSKRLAQCRVPLDVFNALPEKPGVYLFYGEMGELLYIGKAKNLKERVLSHFYEDYKTGKELLLTEKTETIEVRETSGELSALLLESELVKTLRPLYNRYLKTRKQYIVATRQTLAGGYFTAKLEAVPEIENPKEILGIYPSVKKAKELLFELCDAHTLCPKILGLDKSKEACFSHHLKKCKGACTGIEPSYAYNIRFIEAFGKRPIQTWPYDGPVTIEERSADGKSGVTLKVDGWKLLEKTEFSEGEEKTTAYDLPFDFDAYKIISRLLAKPHARIKIKSGHSLARKKVENIA